MRSISKFMIIVLTIITIVGVVMVGCAGEEEATPTPTATQQKTAAPTSAPTSVPTAKPTPTPEPITLSVATVFSTASPEWEVAYAPFKKEVEEKSNGRLIIELYPAASLVPFLGSLDAAIEGAADIAFTAPLYHLDVLPLEGVWTIGPFWQTATGGLEVYLDLYDEYFKQAYTDLGLHRIGTTISRPYWMFTKSKDIQDIDDFQGLNVRTGTAAHAEIFTALGANPVSMTSTETYDALQKGTLDAAPLYPQILESFKWYETGDPGYIIDVGGLPTSTGTHVMNMGVYESLPPDLQKIIDDAGYKYFSMDWCVWNDEEHAIALQKMEDYGNVISTWPSNEQEELRTGYINPQVNDWMAEMDAKGYPGTELVNAIKEKVKIYE